MTEQWNTFATKEPTSWADDHVPLRDLMGIGRADGALSLLNSPYLTQEWELPEAVMLLSGDGHPWIALDYQLCRPTGEPPVTWLDAELEMERRTFTRDGRFVEFARGVQTKPDDQPGAPHKPPALASGSQVSYRRR